MEKEQKHLRLAVRLSLLGAVLAVLCSCVAVGLSISASKEAEAAIKAATEVEIQSHLDSQDMWALVDYQQEQVQGLRQQYADLVEKIEHTSTLQDTFDAVVLELTFGAARATDALDERVQTLERKTQDKLSWDYPIISVPCDGRMCWASDDGFFQSAWYTGVTSPGRDTLMAKARVGQVCSAFEWTHQH